MQHVQGAYSGLWHYLDHKTPSARREQRRGGFYHLTGRVQDALSATVSLTACPSCPHVTAAIRRASTLPHPGCGSQTQSIAHSTHTLQTRQCVLSAIAYYILIVEEQASSSRISHPVLCPDSVNGQARIVLGPASPPMPQVAGLRLAATNIRQASILRYC